MKQHIDLIEAIAQLRADYKSMLIMVTEVQSFIRTLEMMSGVYIALSMGIISLLIYIHKTNQDRQAGINQDMLSTSRELAKSVSVIGRILDRNQLTEEIKK